MIPYIKQDICIVPSIRRLYIWNSSLSALLSFISGWHNIFHKSFFFDLSPYSGRVLFLKHFLIHNIFTFLPSFTQEGTLGADPDTTPSPASQDFLWNLRGCLRDLTTLPLFVAAKPASYERQKVCHCLCGP